MPWVPNAYVASQIDVFNGLYRLQATDPSGPPPPAIELPEGPMNGFFQAYYAPFVSILRTSPQRQRRNYDGVLFETTEISPRYRFGMEASLYERYGSASFAADVGRALINGFPNTTPDRVFVDPTGLSFELEPGWEALNLD
jgi:hypothetical protein